MNPTHTRKSYFALCTALLTFGSLALPTATLAAENDRPDPAPIGQSGPQSAAMPGNPSSSGLTTQGVPLTSTQGSPVAAGGDKPGTSAWCDPISNDCVRRPWLNGVQGE